MWSRIRESLEGPLLRQNLRRADETSPRRAGHRASHTHSSHTKLRGILHRQSAGRADQEVDWFRGDRVDHGFHMLTFRNARSVETIGTSIGIPRQPANHLINVVDADEKTFRTSHQHRTGALDRLMRSTNPVRRMFDFVERLILSAAVVF